MILGIDPGFDGALAIITPTNPPRIAFMRDMPTRIGPNGKKEMDVDTAAMWIAGHSQDIRHAALEWPHALPQDAGHLSSAWKLAVQCGELHGVLTAFMLNPRRCDPATWKGSAGLTSDKKLSVRMARKAFPQDAERYFKYWNTDGRAEAALLALWAMRRSGRR